VFLYDLDDLRAVAQANLAERRREAAFAEAIVESEITEFLAWRRSLDVVPLLVELRRRGDNVRREEVAKVLPRLGTLSPAQIQAVEAAAQAIVNKLLHAPTVQLKELARTGDGAGIRAVRGLLELDPARA
jgi:glutamyl-tRNA reductase